MEPIPSSPPPIRIVGVCGSLRPASYTRRVLRIALEGAAAAGSGTELLDLGDFPLVFCAGKPNEVEYPEGVTRFRRTIRAADGIVLATPEYHGSFSGVLKNALDLLETEDVEGKMMGLVGVSGGRVGAVDALNGLRNVGRVLHAWVVPAQASVPEAWRAFREDGSLRDPELDARVRGVGRDVVRFARLHQCGDHLGFLKTWETATTHPEEHNVSATPPPAV